MISFKCKMCGGDLTFEPGASVAECPYCGTNQTLPKLGDDKRTNLYDRANHFRRQNEYDKAMAIYEQILAEDRTDAEAYWSLVLCRYGIEYVEDPASHKRIPTVNRVQYASILVDEDYKSALQHADETQKAIYINEALAIEKIQKEYLIISSQETPFDIFLCYKETDANGRRTPDSSLANDIYYQLSNEGYKVFYSRITLEEKLGYQYEPYIFAALNSAKVMLVIGTKAEYFNAVWVKNEWSRFLTLMKEDHSRILIPCYRNMDPYDLPDEFALLQSQDMSRIGFIQDIIYGINKILKERTPVDDTVSDLNNMQFAQILENVLNDQLSRYRTDVSEKEKRITALRVELKQYKWPFRQKDRTEKDKTIKQLQDELSAIYKRCDAVYSFMRTIQRYPEDRERWVDYVIANHEKASKEKKKTEREIEREKTIDIKSLGCLPYFIVLVIGFIVFCTIGMLIAR